MPRCLEAISFSSLSAVLASRITFAGSGSIASWMPASSASRSAYSNSARRSFQASALSFSGCDFHISSESLEPCAERHDGRSHLLCGDHNGWQTRSGMRASHAYQDGPCCKFPRARPILMPREDAASRISSARPGGNSSGRLGNPADERIRLNALKPVYSNGFKNLIDVLHRIGSGEDGGVHQTPPATLASSTRSPDSAERAIATMACTEATPSWTSAPRMGEPLRIVSAKPSS